ncbi:MAG: VOC family protein [Bacteroidota bacterium]
MQIKEITLELMVKDVNESVAFYEKFFEFELSLWEPEEGNLEWAKMQKGDFSLSFKLAQKVRKEVSIFSDKETGGTLALCLQVEGSKELYERLKDRVEVVNPPHLSACGLNEFSILDNNGYLITIDEVP